MNSRSTHAVVGLCGNDVTITRWSRPRLLVRGAHVREEVLSGTHAHVVHAGAREDRAPDVDRVRRARHQRGVARPDEREHQVREPFLRTDRRADLGLEVERDAERALVEVGDRLAQLRDAAARRVPVVARIAHRFGQLLDRDRRRRHVGVAEREVDDVLACSPELHLQRVDLRERVRRQRVDPAELHDASTVPVGLSALRVAFPACRNPKAVLLDVGGVLLLPDPRSSARRAGSRRLHATRRSARPRALRRRGAARRHDGRHRVAALLEALPRRLPHRVRRPRRAARGRARAPVERARVTRALWTRIAPGSPRRSAARSSPPASGSASCRTRTGPSTQQLATYEHRAGRPGRRHRSRVRRRLHGGRRGEARPADLRVRARSHGRRSRGRVVRGRHACLRRRRRAQRRAPARSSSTRTSSTSTATAIGSAPWTRLRRLIPG